MPSQLHEAIVRLFRNRPQLAPELLAEALEIELPADMEARIESADLTDIEPAEYRADLVVLLYERAPVLAIVVPTRSTGCDRPRSKSSTSGPNAS